MGVGEVGGSSGAGGVAQGELEGLRSAAVRGEGLRSELAVGCKSSGDMLWIWGRRHWGCSWLPGECVWRGS